MLYVVILFIIYICVVYSNGDFNSFHLFLTFSLLTSCRGVRISGCLTASSALSKKPRLAAAAFLSVLEHRSQVQLLQRARGKAFHRAVDVRPCVSIVCVAGFAVVLSTDSKVAIRGREHACDKLPTVC